MRRDYLILREPRDELYRGLIHVARDFSDTFLLHVPEADWKSLKAPAARVLSELRPYLVKEERTRSLPSGEYAWDYRA